MTPTTAHGQSPRTVSGTVTDAYGPVAGASVTVKGTTLGTATGQDGNFTIAVPQGGTLVITGMGNKTREVNVGTQTSLSIKLETDSQKIEDVVVIGYGTQKKSLVTGAISQVKGDQLEKTGVINAAGALAGKVAGVQVISDNGQPGSGVQMVVRGVGTNGQFNPLYIVDGVDMAGISYLNAADIESVEVLKDAASSAIYGARGANGVVIITTKKGKEGQSTINYSFTYGISNIVRKLPMLSAKEYAIIRNEMSVNGGSSPQFTDEQINSFDHGTDWQEAILNRNAATVQHNLSLLGGSQRTTYALSASYLDQNGTFAKGKSEYKRYTVNFKGDQKFLRGDVLRVGQNISFARVENNSITGNSLTGGPITMALNMDPLTPVYDDYTKYSDYNINKAYYDLYHGYAYSRYVNPDYTNPAALIHFMNPDSYWTTAKATAYAELTLLKHLKLRGSLSADMTWTQTYSYTQPRRFNPSTVYNTENGTSQSSSESQRYNSDFYATYAKTFCKKHDVSLMAGSQLLQTDGLSLSASRDGLLTTDIDKAYVSLAKGPNQGASGGPYDSYILLSYFARANYAYDNRYVLTGTYRRDGSSNFGPDNKFANFYSFSLGWNVSNEKFMQNVEAIDNLKVRGSWGQNGNDNIAQFLYIPTVRTSSQLGYVFGSNAATVIATGGAPLALANPGIRWEASEQFNVGFDATILKDWTITADYYSKTTKDQLVTSPIPLFLGNGFPTVNAGNVRNRGFEFMLGWRKRFANDLVLNLSGNVAFNKNEVTYVGTESKFVEGMSVSGITGVGNITRMEEGYPMAYFRGLKVNGVFQNWDQVNGYTWTNPETGDTRLIQPSAMPGDLIYKDINNDGVIDTHDCTMIGNPYPKTIYGVNINASWKNFDLTITTSGAAGHQVFSAVRRNITTNNWGRWALDRWTGEGTSNSIPRLTDADNNGNWSNSSELFIQDADYFRIREVALGYTFHFSPKYYVQKVNVFTSVTNLMTFTKYNRGYDPEVGSSSALNVGTDLGNYPRPRTVSFGLNLTF